MPAAVTALPRVPAPADVFVDGENPHGTTRGSDGGSAGGTAHVSGRPNVVLGASITAVMSVAAALLLAAVRVEVGLNGLIVGAVFASLPVVPVLAVFLWLDRNEPEPIAYIAFALAWGATVAAVAALGLNTASMEFLRQQGTSDVTVAAVAVAPWVEEAAKGAAVALLALRRRREFDGVVDGLVFAGLCGLGFAFVENILYFGQAYADAAGEHGVLAGLSATGSVFVLRGIGSPFAHPMFTAAIGIGFGIAATSRRSSVRIAAPIGGYLAAVMLHGTWNLAAASGKAGFISAYALVMVPVFAGYVAIMVWARRREARVVGRWLPEYGLAGWFTLDEVAALASLRARRRAREWARRKGGTPGHRAMNSYQNAATELAFLRDRIARHVHVPDFTSRERDLLHAVTGQRRRLAALVAE